MIILDNKGLQSDWALFTLGLNLAKSTSLTALESQR
jgi:hypothetical protein